MFWKKKIKMMCVLSYILVWHWCSSSHRADSRLAHSCWETLLQSNPISHWLGAKLESALSQQLPGVCTGTEPYLQLKLSLKNFSNNAYLGILLSHVSKMLHRFCFILLLFQKSNQVDHIMARSIWEHPLLWHLCFLPADPNCTSVPRTFSSEHTSAFSNLPTIKPLK